MSLKAIQITEFVSFDEQQQYEDALDCYLDIEDALYRYLDIEDALYRTRGALKIAGGIPRPIREELRRECFHALAHLSESIAFVEAERTGRLQ